MSYVDKVIKALDATDIAVQDKKTNLAPYLQEILRWQEISRYAEQHLKMAWKDAQVPNGPLVSDDALRDYPNGETIMTTTERFVFMITLKEGAERFDKDAFFDELVRKFKLDRGKLEVLYDMTKKKLKPSLSKRVIEK